MSSSAILLVDDDPFILESTLDRIRAALPDVTVETAARGDDALARLQLRRFNLLLTDVRMPGLDGLSLLRAARVLQPDLPILLMTSFSDIDLAQAQAAGAQGLLPKPFSAEELITAIRSGLRLDPPPSS